MFFYPCLINKETGPGRIVCPRSHSHPVTDSGLPDSQDNIFSFPHVTLFHVIPEADTPISFLFCGIEAYRPLKIQKDKSTSIFLSNCTIYHRTTDLAYKDNLTEKLSPPCQSGIVFYRW